MGSLWPAQARLYAELHIGNHFSCTSSLSRRLLALLILALIVLIRDVKHRRTIDQRSCVESRCQLKLVPIQGVVVDGPTIVKVNTEHGVEWSAVVN